MNTPLDRQKRADHVTTSIGLADGAGDLRDARRFWYQVYVQEMQRHVADADHKARELCDGFDTLGNLFLARHAGRVVGTVISTYGGVSNLGYYARLYGLDHLSGGQLMQVSLTNKLIVAPEMRHSTLAIRLAVQTYCQGLVDGIDQTFIDCNAHLESFFLRMGFVHHRGWVTHKDYGQVCSMVLNVRNIAHLRSIRSPFVKHHDALLRMGHTTKGSNHRVAC